MGSKASAVIEVSRPLALCHYNLRTNFRGADAGG